ncbi:MAG: sulfatase-like hydrolase/transferase [Bacteroidales bacterium]|nr:sulfatase-like hydrolase/transferase [Bacteroidales bacterium]
MVLTRSFLFLFVGICGMIGYTRSKPDPEKSNLLFVWTDQQQAASMAVYGNMIIQVPNLNKLAEESFVFSKAYVSQAICTPSRSTVMTGLYPHQNNCTSNGDPLDEKYRCLPRLLDEEYRSAYMGKWHLGDEIFRQHGFDVWVSIEDHYYNSFSEGRDRSERSDYHQFLLDLGYEPTDVEENVFSRKFAVSLPIEHCKPKFLEERAIDFLERNRDNPFVLYVNFLEPHNPFSGPLNDLHSREDIPLPENFRDPIDENEPLLYRVLQEDCAATFGKSEEKIRELTGKYWGLISQVDRSLGAILDKLDELGLAENTIVVYTSDHGEMMGAHGLVRKEVNYEEAVRVPWLMRVPWLEKEQVIKEDPVSQIDLVPTLLELMGAEIPEELPGKSLSSYLMGRELPEEMVFIEWAPRGKGRYAKLKYDRSVYDPERLSRAFYNSSRCVVSPDGYKLTVSRGDKSFLFDLNNDPMETTNVIGEESYAPVVERLFQEILQWQERTGDTLSLVL